MSDIISMHIQAVSGSAPQYTSPYHITATYHHIIDIYNIGGTPPIVG